MKRAALLILPALAFPLSAGAHQMDDPAIKICDAIAHAVMKQPESYKVVSADLVQGQGGSDDSHVLITFNGMNSYGAVLRSSADCRFAYENDRQGFWLWQVSIDGLSLPTEIVKSVGNSLNLLRFPITATTLQPPTH